MSEFREIPFSIDFVGKIKVDERTQKLSETQLSELLQLAFLTTYGAFIECMISGENSNSVGDCLLTFDDFGQSTVEVAKMTGLGINENILRLIIRSLSDFAKISTSTRLEEIIDKMNSEKDSSE